MSHVVADRYRIEVVRRNAPDGGIGPHSVRLSVCLSVVATLPPLASPIYMTLPALPGTPPPPPCAPLCPETCDGSW